MFGIHILKSRMPVRYARPVLKTLLHSDFLSHLHPAICFLTSTVFVINLLLPQFCPSPRKIHKAIQHKFGSRREEDPNTRIHLQIRVERRRPKYRKPSPDSRREKKTQIQESISQIRAALLLQKSIEIDMPASALGVDTILLMMECIEDDEILEILVTLVIIACLSLRKRKRDHNPESYSMIARMPYQIRHLNRLIGVTNVDCIANLRMDRNTFGRLVALLRELGGLVDGKYVNVEEQVATFLGILAHHKKNRVVGFDYLRSGETISKYVHAVLKSVLMLHGILLVKPEPVPSDYNDPRWRWFKGCLGALDGTYINVKVAISDKPRYRTRKGQISSNTLAVCDRKLRFVYVLPDWEGSVADSRVLRDAINREHGLKVLKGNYYLADNGYSNSDGFLTPYRSVRYHLKEWGPENILPSNEQEMFNMRHSKARNVIERAFGVMKMRWGILRSASYYPIKMQIMMIAACFLLHNFIRSEMEVDLCEVNLDGVVGLNGEDDDEQEVSFINNVESSSEWNSFRDSIASSMWQART